MNEHDLEFYCGIARERDKLKADCMYLLTELIALQNITGLKGDEDTRSTVARISEDLSA